jgi:hypothetical protein
LYISIFLENFEIRQDRLVWQWIGEGFVHPNNEQGHPSRIKVNVALGQNMDIQDEKYKQDMNVYHNSCNYLPQRAYAQSDQIYGI